MKAMVLNRIHNLDYESTPLRYSEMPIPSPSGSDVLLRVKTCGVCHTELDEIEGRTPPSFFPLIPGHQVVGEVVECGAGVNRFKSGDRVGVAWIFHACGKCAYCLSGNENLCPDFKATGRDAHGGYAGYMTVSEKFAFPIPSRFSNSQAAPLLCAGAVGYRSLRLTGIKNGDILGLTGFGASGHLVLLMVKHRFPDSGVFIFARSEKERHFAMELGADWSGDTTDTPPAPMKAIIDTTPAWKPIVEGLNHLQPGGRLIINAIRKESADTDYLLTLDYPRHLWMEKEIKSVANVARLDVSEFLQLAADIPIIPEVQEYALEDANSALMELKQRNIRGAKVLVMD